MCYFGNAVAKIGHPALQRFEKYFQKLRLILDYDRFMAKFERSRFSDSKCSGPLLQRLLLNVFQCSFCRRVIPNCSFLAVAFKEPLFW